MTIIEETGADPEQDRGRGVLNGKFIVPLLILYDTDRNSGFKMTFPDILNAADKLLRNNSEADLNLAPDAVKDVRQAFALRYFAFSRFNSTEDRRKLSSSILGGTGRDQLCELVLTYPLQVVADVNFGVEFDPDPFEQELRALADEDPEPSDF